MWRHRESVMVVRSAAKRTCSPLAPSVVLESRQGRQGCQRRAVPLQADDAWSLASAPASDRRIRCFHIFQTADLYSIAPRIPPGQLYSIAPRIPPGQAGFIIVDRDADYELSFCSVCPMCAAPPRALRCNTHNVSGPGSDPDPSFLWACPLHPLAYGFQVTASGHVWSWSEFRNIFSS